MTSSGARLVAVFAVGAVATLASACSSDGSDSGGRNVDADGGTSSGGSSSGAGGAQSGAGGAKTGAGGGAAAGGAAASGGTAGANAGGTAGAGAGGTAAGGAPPDGGSGSGGAAGGAGWWKPAPGTSWQWQLSGTLDSSFDVQMYDIDLFDHTKEEFAALQAAGRKVVCYFDTAYEPGRPDSAALDPYRGNKVAGWPGQFWLDLREPKVLEVMKARVALAAEKGCDGIEADDVDHRSNSPGFPITAAQQQAFITALADEAHARGMAFGLKNDLDEIDALVGVSDFAINEECFQYDECDLLAPFIEAGKAVFQVEYTEGNLANKGGAICPGAIALDFDTLIKRLDLDAPRYSCR